MEILDNRNVAVFKTLDTTYPTVKPYHPSEKYPEIRYDILTGEQNNTFASVRETLALLDLDRVNYGKSTWNPFGVFIKPDDIVVIKPNLVSHYNWGYRKGLTDTDSLITHGSVIRAVIDYVVIALSGKGKIIIGDSPIQSSSWDDLMEMIGFKEMKLFFETNFPEICLQSCDFRLDLAKLGKWGSYKIFEGQINENYIETDLGALSMLSSFTQQSTSFGVADYSKKRLNETHSFNSHKYLFPKLVFEANVVINLPKLKSHSKAGLTGALKNLVGINGLKDYLPHFRIGCPATGGDEFPDKGYLFSLINDVAHLEWECTSYIKRSLYNILRKILKRIYMIFTGNTSEIFSTTAGGWIGNDTLWRTILDINRVFLYADAESDCNEKNITTKKYFTLIDGIIGGEKLSPLLPTPVRSGLIIAGINPVAIDTTASALMGFDYKKIPQLSNAYNLKELPLVNFAPEEIIIKSNQGFKSLEEINLSPGKKKFTPSPGFLGHIEI